MGIEDRDWYHEHRREQERGGNGGKPPRMSDARDRRDSWMPLLVAYALVLLIAGVVRRYFT